MLIDKKRERIVCLSQDPKTIFSYGLQVKELITGLKEYQWHVISNQYNLGTPFQDKDIDYITWAHEGEERRCTTTLRKVINHTNPLCVFSMGDIHHHAQIPIGKPLQVPWVSWFPWDNHDTESMEKSSRAIQTPDIKVTMSEFSYNLMTDMGLEIDEMIYNIIDTDVFKPKKIDREKIYKLNPVLRDKKILLFVGRPSWRKNIEFLLSAFKEISRVREDVLLYLHVDFNDEGVFQKPNIPKMIHGLGLSHKIIHTEQNRWDVGIPSKFLTDLYNLVDVYVTPHGGEGFGLPICEAMACGVPFVATNCTSMPEFAGDGKRGLLAKVDKNVMEKGIYRPWVDIEDFIDKVLYILEDENERTKMGKRGHYWVRSNCSKIKIIPQWQKVFEKLDVPYCSVDHATMLMDWNDSYKSGAFSIENN